jgi:hypothetical protein
LRRGFAQNEFELYFQPQVRLIKGQRDRRGGSSPALEAPGTRPACTRRFHRDACGKLDCASSREMGHPDGMPKRCFVARRGTLPCSDRRKSVPRAIA